MAMRRRFGPALASYSSWQPLQDASSPGIACVQLRMSWRARPFSSSGWMEIGTFAGTLK